MSDWLHALPVGWMAVVVIGGTHDRPFTGQLAVGPAALIQVLPDGPREVGMR